MADIDAEAVEFGMILEEEESCEFMPRLRNNGVRQHRQFTGYDQNLPMVVYGCRKATVHGTDRAGTTPMTVVVFRWMLQKRDPGRRFKSATLRAIFSTRHRKPGFEDDSDHDSTDSTDNGVDNHKLIDHYYDPNVATVFPSGTHALTPTISDVTETRTCTLEGNAQVALGAGPATATLGGGAAFQLSTTVITTNSVIISGMERNERDKATGSGGLSVDRCNVAEWQLFENEATRSGLPTDFCTAVRLERRRWDEAEFTVRFEIKTTVDVVTDNKTKLKRFLGLLPHDDPIIFDPHIEEPGPLAAWKDRLDELEPYEECNMVMHHKMPERE